MKKSMIRLLSLMLCLITLFSLLPMTALAATTPGKPTSLSWGKNYYRIWDTGKVTYEEKPGYMTWKAQKPYCSGETWFIVNVYRDGKKVGSTNIGYTKDWIEETNGYISIDINTVMDISTGRNLELKSGAYHFTVEAASNWDGTNGSGKVKSGTWGYTKPDSKVSKPTGVKWDWPYAKWDKASDPSTTYGIEVYFSETKTGEKHLIHTATGWYENKFEVPGYKGTGYYSFRVRTLSNDITKKYHSSWVTVGEDEYFKLAKPTVTHKSDTATGKPKISWKISDSYTKKYIEKYEVYRATSKDGEYKKVKTTTKTSFLDEEATAGKVYYYKVRGVTQYDGEKTSFSSVVSRYCDLPQPKVKGTNVSSSGDPKLSWGKISGAEKYYVYRATSKDGDYEKIKSTTSTSYTDSSAKAGKKYYYKVKAIHAKESANSAYSEPLAKYSDLSRPDVSIKLNSGGDPKLSWGKISGAEKYYVYRATSKSGDYKKIKTTTSTSFTDKDVKAGKTYYYKVKAIHSNSSANSAYSSVDYIKAK